MDAQFGGHAVMTDTTPTVPTDTVAIPGQTRIGHIHLRVADLERSVHFYHVLLGFEIVCNLGTAAFLAAGGYHHHLGLNTWESAGGQPPAPGTTGLYHFAINYPTRRDLAVALKRLLDHGWSIDGAKDHTTHEAIYLHDPDCNGIELAWDRDPSYWTQWFRATMEQMPALNKPLDFDGLLAELGEPAVTDAAKYLPTLRTFT
jgi:catechol 2,3-dioxygenase